MELLTKVKHRAGFFFIIVPNLTTIDQYVVTLLPALRLGDCFLLHGPDVAANHLKSLAMPRPVTQLAARLWLLNSFHSEVNLFIHALCCTASPVLMQALLTHSW